VDTHREYRYGSAVAVVGRALDELIIKSQVELRQLGCRKPMHHLRDPKSRGDKTKKRER
jgi:hypothetical protein